MNYWYESLKFKSEDTSKLYTPSTLNTGLILELVSKELNHLVAILHVYAGGLK